ncbi:MAG: hypothetical protein ACI4LN_02055 [Anaerovoracaceae bacterium]
MESKEKEIIQALSDEQLDAASGGLTSSTANSCTGAEIRVYKCTSCRREVTTSSRLEACPDCGAPVEIKGIMWC